MSVNKSWKENNLLYKYNMLKENENYITFGPLHEKIYGNIAIVYHRGDKNKLNYLLKGTYSNKSYIDFDKYNRALYTTFDLKSQLNTDKYQKNDMKRTYGKYIIKLAVKGISNFWFCDFNIYKQYHPNTTPETWKEEQFRKFNINKDLRKELGDDTLWFDHTIVSKFFEKYGALGKRVKGTVYHGEYDGNCILIYDWTTAIPIAISSNEGKTWEKVSGEKTEGLRRNFSKNNYIDTNKKMVEPLFQVNEHGDIRVNKKVTSLVGIGIPKIIKGNFDCSSCENLISLEGAPEIVKGNFNCSGCKSLTSLKGAPKEVGINFYCYDCENLISLVDAPIVVNGSFNCSWCNNLISLKGAPQIVGGNFYCFDCENLISLKGAPIKVEGNFNCSNCSKLTSLEGFNTKVGGSFYADDRLMQLYNQKYR